MGRILIVDDEPNMRRILASNLRQDQHQIWEAGGVEEAQRALATNDLDVVITDQKMPDGEGLTVLASAREVDPTLPVILLTAVATIELAVESMRHGAFDFLAKPFEPDVVRATARRAYELGLVNKVVPDAMTIEIAKRTARGLAEKPPLALRMAKEAVLKAFESPLSEGLAGERKSFYFLFSTEDQKEGMHAFLEKRKGVFKGR